MGSKFNRSLFIFHRDLRLEDNTALIKALEQSDSVVPCFIFDPALVEKDPPNNHAIQFMMESLNELNKELTSYGSQLNYLYGKPWKVIGNIQQTLSFDAVFSNLDYSPYATKRSSKIDRLCENAGIKFLQYSDYLLTNPETIYTGSGDRYSVFTYFYKKATEEQTVKPVVENSYTNYLQGSLSQSESGLFDKYRPTPNPSLFVNGGRSNGLVLLDKVDQLEEYDKLRDFPHKDGTSKLSAHNKFGTISIREFYHEIANTLGADHPLIRQLYWRDFYVYLAIHYPHVFTKSFRRKYEQISWENDKTKYQRWCEGKTGFPIVDAGMRQLNTTGYMHNRIRMIVASFLVKDLHIDWRWGERYFAKKLVDYDVMVNNGNWQWAASTGADAQPYFRIFNPWSQQKKYDPNCAYIKKYIEELDHLQPRTIHNLSEQRPLDIGNYPPPMIIHKNQAKKAKEMFKAIS